ncbi:GDSL-type esterase/lipase family protein [Porphyromonas sp. COT-108 OH1349]|uniref:GDSL-type esterase/lipase family protein n=1 Tax=Porphyromonas sp. COT-108 OH1349 TaxID=1537504 RepID=UPI0009DE3FE6|nr:GDSL-type esterase/lipase family protein [Porphyromonas sp. COT-108 OH1349]
MTKLNKKVAFLLLLIFGMWGAQAQTKLLHLGDSHIRYGYTTAPIKALLTDFSVSYTGINGATFSTFTDPQQIQNITKMQPEVLVVSLGTNDSYTWRFSESNFRQQLEDFTSAITQALPNVQLFFTTPPPSFLKQSKRIRNTGKKSKRKWRTTYSYLFNPNTAKAAAIILDFANSNGYGVYDLYQQIGTEEEAQRWVSKGWMHQDHIHYTKEGYFKHGALTAEALRQFLDQSSHPSLISSDMISEVKLYKKDTY